jgi:hypothetical protein
MRSSGRVIDSPYFFASKWYKTKPVGSPLSVPSGHARMDASSTATVFLSSEMNRTWVRMTLSMYFSHRSLSSGDMESKPVSAAAAVAVVVVVVVVALAACPPPFVDDVAPMDPTASAMAAAAVRGPDSSRRTFSISSNRDLMLG